MLIVSATFPAGRYHATPWGMHVNEGAVEWPPSPWRFLRALVAVGFSRLGWREIPEPARVLFDSLARVLPVYHLPPAQGGHTRHYMPPYSGNTTKVLDTFAYVGTEMPLALELDVALEPTSRALFAELLHAMPYLGRAEAWVEAKLVDAVPRGLARCAPSDSIPGPGFERVALLAPEESARYAAYRSDAISRASAELFDAEAAPVEGKKARVSSKVAKALAEIEALYPTDLIAALLADTVTLQRQGWSQPPGTRWVSYWRAAGALHAGPRPVATRRAPEAADTALFALASVTPGRDLLPPMTDAVRRMDVIHKALVDKSAAAPDGPSPVFTGRRDGVLLEGHQHATLTPLALDGRSDRIDHVLIHAPMGFDDAARAALNAVRRTYASKIPPLSVSLVGIGQRSDFSTTVRALRSATTWVSATPFVLPRHRKPRGKNTLAGQIGAELSTRGLFDVASIEVELDGDRYVDAEALDGNELRRSLRFRHFRLERAERPPPQATSFALRITFTEPVRGPIALGYGSHFGLGAMVPAEV